MNVLNEVRKNYKHIIGKTLSIKGKILRVVNISRHPIEKEFLVFNFNDNSYLKIADFKKEMIR